MPDYERITSAVRLGVARANADPLVSLGDSVARPFVSVPGRRGAAEVVAGAVGAGSRCVIGVGPHGSETGRAVMTALPVSNGLVSVSPFATATTLAPPLARAAPADAERAAAMLLLLTGFGITDVVLLYTDDTFGAGFALDFARLAVHRNVTVRRQILVEAAPTWSVESPAPRLWNVSLAAAMREVRESIYGRVVLVSADPLAGPEIARAAHGEGLTGRGTVWMMTDGLDLVASQAAEAGAGWVAVAPRGDAGPSRTAFLEAWRSADPAVYPGAGRGGAESPSLAVMLAHDAGMLAARAVQRVLWDTAGTGLAVTPERVAAVLPRVSFLGATGSFSLTSDTLARAGMPYDVLNLRPSPSGTVVTVGTVEPGAVEPPVRTEDIVWPGGSSASPGVGSSARGKTFRALTIESPPFVIATPAGAASGAAFTGLLIDLVRRIEGELGCTIELELLGQGLSYNDAVASVARGEFDLLVADTVVTSARLDIVRFTHATVQTHLSIVGKRPATQAEPFRFAKPLQGLVWLFILAALFIGALVVYVAETGHSSHLTGISDKSHPLLESFWFCCAGVSFTQQYDLRSFSGRLFTVGWMAVVLVLTTFYTASLTASLTVQRLQRGVDGIDDLVNRPTGVVGGGAVLAYAESVPLRDIVTAPSTEALFALLDSGEVGHVILDDLWARRPLRDKCDLAILGAPFRRSLWAWPVAADFAHLGEFNKVISDAWSSEFLTGELIERWLGSPDDGPCEDQSAEAWIEEGIAARDVAGVMIIFAGTVVASVAVSCLWHGWTRNADLNNGSIDPAPRDDEDGDDDRQHLRPRRPEPGKQHGQPPSPLRSPAPRSPAPQQEKMLQERPHPVSDPAVHGRSGGPLGARGSPSSASGARSASPFKNLSLVMRSGRLDESYRQGAVEGNTGTGSEGSGAAAPIIFRTPRSQSRKA